MYTISRDRFPGWSQVNEWRHRVHLHHELQSFPDRHLQDIGISCRTADYRQSRPFWMM
jgi:uncharacterized protein YjiS (DUF1127 family)